MKISPGKKFQLYGIKHKKGDYVDSLLHKIPFFVIYMYMCAHTCTCMSQILCNKLNYAISLP
jgi:hypothetical protein